MNKIDITSDLHLDFWIDPQNSQKKQEKMMRRLISCLLPDEPSNVLVIAGDTGHYNWQNVMFIKLLKETYNHICIVFGNHDLYLVSDKMKKSRIIEYLINYFGEGILSFEGKIERGKILIDTIKEDGFSVRVYNHLSTKKSVSMMARSAGRPIIYFPSRLSSSFSNC